MTSSGESHRNHMNHLVNFYSVNFNLTIIRRAAESPDRVNYGFPNNAAPRFIDKVANS